MYSEINSEEYREQFESGESGDYQLLDVREIDEYAAGHIPGTKNIPLSQFQQRVDEISEDSPVILVCATGARSGRAATFLASMGYENLYNHSDGTKGWIAKGYPAER
jgi:rhodanese-related sulfurtransferase